MLPFFQMKKMSQNGEKTLGGKNLWATVQQSWDVEKGHAWNGLMVQKTILVQIQLVALALVLRSAATTAGQVEK